MEKILSLLREREWLASDMRIFSKDDAEFRLVPIDPGSPIALPAPFDKYETEVHEGQPDNRIDSDWWNHLTNLLGPEVIATHGEAWPSSHEFISDMMIVRIEDGLDRFSAQIRRVSGGDFLSAGGNRGFLWEMFLYKTYSKELIYSMDPFDSRVDDHYSGILLGRNGSFRLKF